MRPTTAGPLWIPTPIFSGSASSAASNWLSWLTPLTISVAAFSARRQPSFGSSFDPEQRHHAVTDEFIGRCRRRV